MQRFNREFQDHPVHSALVRVRDQLGALPEPIRDSADAQDPQDVLARLDQVLEYVAALLGSVDPALTSHAMLEAANGPLEQISSALTPLEDSEDLGQVATIHGNTDALVAAAVQLAPAIGIWAKEDMAKAAAALGAAAMEKTSALEGRADSLAEQAGRARPAL